MCTACPANTYKTTLGDHKCSACPLNTVSPPGSKRLTDCVCKPGYFSIKGPGLACDQCPEYTWKNFTGSERCNSCPANTRSPAGSLNLSDCVCLKGYYGPDGQACSACSFGSYKSEVGSGPCLSCPYANMTSPAGSIGRPVTCRTWPTGMVTSIILLSFLGWMSQISHCNYSRST